MIQQLEQRNVKNHVKFHEIDCAAQNSKALHMRVIKLQNQVDTLHAENRSLRIHKSSNSSLEDSAIQKYASLSRKLLEVEEKLTSREEELNYAIERTKASCSSEIRKIQDIHEEEMNEKDRLIRSCGEKLHTLTEKVMYLAQMKESTKEGLC